MDLAQVTLEVMKPLEGKTFSVSLPDGSETSMKLEEVIGYPERMRRSRRNPAASLRTPFSLFFVGSADRVLPQGVYDFQADDVQFPGMFIVPVGNDETGTEYEAVFT
jgi:hypothetical protein